MGAPAYTNLGHSLRLHDKVQIDHGSGNMEWTRRSLFTRALELDPSDARAYDGLGFSIGAEERVRLAHGREWTQAELLSKALELDPSHASAQNGSGPSAAVVEQP